MVLPVLLSSTHELRFEYTEITMQIQLLFLKCLIKGRALRPVSQRQTSIMSALRELQIDLT